MAATRVTSALRTAHGGEKHAWAKPVVLVVRDASSWPPAQRRRAWRAPPLPRTITQAGLHFAPQYQAPRSPT
eukprot:3804050-Pyramimonas_sp.AAC.1